MTDGSPIAGVGRESAQPLLAIWEFAADAMVLSDLEGTVIAANPAYCRLYGYSQEEIVGQSFAVIFPEELRAWAKQGYKETFAQQDIRPAVESEIRRKDGSTGVVEVRYTFLLEDGRRTAMLSQIRDVTQNRQAQAHLESERARVAAILEATTEGIYGMDREGRCTFINSAALGFLGYAAEECLGRNMHELVHYQHRDGTPYPIEHCPIYRVLQDGVPTRLLDETLWHKDGTPRPALYSCSPIVDEGRVVGGVVTIVDITERRRGEEERAQLLAQERAARVLAERAVRAQEELLSVVSHDLSNPISVIKGVTQLLQRRLSRGNEPDPTHLAAELTKIASAATRIENFIRDLASPEHLQPGQSLSITPRRVDLVALARRVAESHQLQTERHHLAVEAQSAELTGYWDPARLEQVLDNLVSNAVKYSPQGGVVRIGVGYERSAGDDADSSPRAMVTVQDEGLGIPEKDINHIFEWYRRGTNVRSVINGTGVGLAGARQIVEQHGGRIEVESREGAGSTFTVLLPLGGEATTGQEESRTEGSG
ncbi:MAG TPA: PAS domain S-box protein [Chloroflexia bacterium]